MTETVTAVGASRKQTFDWAAFVARYGVLFSEVHVGPGTPPGELKVMIAELRKESEESTKAIRKSVEEGKKKYQETLARHARATS